VVCFFGMQEVFELEFVKGAVVVLVGDRPPSLIS
jgi:hypothetical protein